MASFHFGNFSSIVTCKFPVRTEFPTILTFESRRNTMTRRFPFLAVALALLFPLVLVDGQTNKEPEQTNGQKSKPTVSKDQAAKGAAVAEPDPEVAQRRTTAISLLTSLADDARSFKDQALRARVQARAADALWTTEPDRARDLFRRAWDAAEIGDAETARRVAEDSQRQRQQTGMVVTRNRREMRLEVLRLMAKRDKKLTEEFLQKLED